MAKECEGARRGARREDASGDLSRVVARLGRVRTTERNCRMDSDTTRQEDEQEVQGRFPRPDRATRHEPRTTTHENTKPRNHEPHLGDLLAARDDALARREEARPHEVGAGVTVTYEWLRGEILTQHVITTSAPRPHEVRDHGERRRRQRGERWVRAHDVGDEEVRDLAPATRRRRRRRWRRRRGRRWWRATREQGRWWWRWRATRG